LPSQHNSARKYPVIRLSRVSLGVTVERLTNRKLALTGMLAN
jgi:hypothetical protein